MPFQYGQTREQRRIRHNVRIGSFEGGVNRLFLRDALNMPNNQVVDCVNLDPIENGLLRSRIGIKIVGKATNYYTATTGYVNTIIGYLDNSGPVIAERLATGGSTTLRTPATGVTAAVVGSVLTAQVNQRGFSSYVRYNGVSYIIPVVQSNATGPQFLSTWSGTDKLNLTTVVSLPAGDHGFMWKSRMWVIDKTFNRIYWSKTSDPTTWAAPDGGFIDMKDTEDSITAYAVTTDALYIFKKRSTYQITYNVDPGTDIYVRTVSSTQGAYNALSYKGVIYTFDNKGIYKFLNNVFYDLSQVLNFTVLYYGVTDATFSASKLAVINDKLILSAAVTGSTSKVPVMNIKTGAWTFYDNAALVGPVQVSAFNNINYLVLTTNDVWWTYGSSRETVDTDYCDTDNSANAYDVYPEYSFITKPQDLAYPDIWKRVHSLKSNGHRQTVSPADAQTVTFNFFLEQDAPTTVNNVVTGSLVSASADLGVQEMIPVLSFRFHMFSIQVLKPKVVSTSNNGNSYFEFKHFTGDISYKGESFYAD